ncbi:hypothetical protein GOP47_0007510 [Adiantum capillus-veneris]|uniref:Glycosyltransferase family 92 protein n=1 Tax=Adiantum capillus-veneris TaxID=13818 RepID=A0A9D4V0U6_ADICA|nr:hypothetical protein GOP47_0007510 [Adiantum capillus-veneris]
MTRWEHDCAGCCGRWRCFFQKVYMHWVLLVVALGLLLFWDASFYQGCSEDSRCGGLISRHVANDLLRDGEHEHNLASLQNVQEVLSQQRESSKKAIYKDSPSAIGINPLLSVIQAAVAFNESVLLLMNPPFTGLRNALQEEIHQLRCLFAKGVQTDAVMVEDGMVQCKHPQNAMRKSVTGSVVTLKFDSSILPATALYGKIGWKKLVYGVSPLEDDRDILLFVKGLSHSKRSLLPDGLECLYGDNVRTQVTAFCQENVRCKLPARRIQHEVNGKSVTIVLRDKIFPSVVRFSLGTTHFDTHTVVVEETQRPFFLCVCSLVWNGAKFLKEWIMYHSSLGAQRFFLYDNNSDDDIENVLESLRSYNVSRHPWPWLKTQEASFSHCAVRASSQCKWVAFIDLDEFIFPKGFVHTKVSEVIEPPLHCLIKEYDRVDKGKLGQLKISNFNFGPSGLRILPKSGQMVNYICRMSVPKRVKSIVRASAIHPSYCSRVHYFELKAGYVAAQAVRRDAVIHHFKYHAWEDFKLKFVRRAATFVTDWGQNKDLDSFDRTPGLGTQAVEPLDWAHQFCEIEDTSLRDYVMNTSNFYLAGKLLWE